MSRARLYSYWRSTAAYRVRIALNLKGIDYETIAVDLKPGIDAQKSAAYTERNPQGLIPFFEDGNVEIGQSLAILAYLDEQYKEPPLLPNAPQVRGDVRSVAQLIACDIHPLNNIGVLTFLGDELGIDAGARGRWYENWIHRGFQSIEKTIREKGDGYTIGDSPTLADVCLVPQVYNARRFNVPLGAYPGIVAVEERCLASPAFDRARPERQPDAPDGE